MVVQRKDEQTCIVCCDGGRHLCVSHLFAGVLQSCRRGGRTARQTLYYRAATVEENTLKKEIWQSKCVWTSRFPYAADAEVLARAEH